MEDFIIKEAGALKNFLAEMATQLGVAAEHLYGVLIRQQFIEGGTQIFTWICMFIFWIWLFKSYRKKYKLFFDTRAIKHEGWENERHEGPMWVYGLLSLGFGIATIICFFTLFTAGITQIANPEFYALKDVFEFIRGPQTPTK